MNIDKAYPSTYLKASDLPEKGVTVIIESLEMETIGEDDKPVLHFQGKEKTLVLNKTNAQTISEVLRTPETDEWIGQKIAIYPTETDFQGKRVPCIRVRLRTPQAGTKPVPPPEPPLRDEEFDDDSVPF